LWPVCPINMRGLVQVVDGVPALFLQFMPGIIIQALELSQVPAFYLSADVALGLGVLAGRLGAIQAKVLPIRLGRLFFEQQPFPVPLDLRQLLLRVSEVGLAGLAGEEEAPVFLDHLPNWVLADNKLGVNPHQLDDRGIYERGQFNVFPEAVDDAFDLGVSRVEQVLAASFDEGRILNLREFVKEVIADGARGDAHALEVEVGCGCGHSKGLGAVDRQKYRSGCNPVLTHNFLVLLVLA